MIVADAGNRRTDSRKPLPMARANPDVCMCGASRRREQQTHQRDRQREPQPARTNHTPHPLPLLLDARRKHDESASKEGEELDVAETTKGTWLPTRRSPQLNPLRTRP